jgi:thiol-disulfide isomerase/thioredoxin
MPDLEGAIGRLNSAPLNANSLRGKVALVNFWTYTRINSLRPIPYLKNWGAKYNDAGFVVLGAHTPEVLFEHQPVNVENAFRNLNVTFPVVIDSKSRIWQSFNNQYWPAQYLVDAKGRIRYPHFGEGDYGKIERVIQELLKERGERSLPPRPERPGQWSGSRASQLLLAGCFQGSRRQQLGAPGDHNAASRSRQRRRDCVRLRKRAGERASACGGRPSAARKAHRAARRELARLVRRAHSGGAGWDGVADVSDYPFIVLGVSEAMW